MDNNIEKLKSIAIKAGELIMSYYKKDLAISIKEDDSLVTSADIESNELIVKELYQLDSNIPIISEENPSNILKDNHDDFWLVDPLDGTNGYVKQNDQFTVNIALISNRMPVLGIIYIPVTKELFYNLGNKAYKQTINYITEIRTKKASNEVILTSSTRDISCNKTDQFINKVTPSEIIHMSSSIKFCMVAEGKVDLYPKFSRTMEWDSAAGHAIVNAAGGRVEDLNGSELLYGKELFENKGFIVYGHK